MYGPAELYRLQEDPLATADVAGENRDTVEELQQLLISYLVEHGATPEFIELWDPEEE
jgi:hypothetical protein